MITNGEETTELMIWDLCFDSPEQLNGEEYDCRTDILVGIIMYDMLNNFDTEMRKY